MNTACDSDDACSAPTGGGTNTGEAGGGMSPSLRWSCYWLLIFVALGAVTGRIMSVNSVDKIGLEERLKSEAAAGRRTHWQLQRPFLSANDRSRWAAVRSLVEHGTYEIDAIVDQPNWDTIDMVMHKNRQGELRRYSSKPPLFSTMVAGLYWPIYRFAGLDLGRHPHLVGRVILFFVNVLPLAAYFWAIACLAERFAKNDWSRLFLVAAAGFGTYLTTYANVLNNHLPGAVCVAIATELGLRIWYDGNRCWRVFLSAGLFAALAVAEELPALSFFGLLSLALLYKAPRLTLQTYAPAAALVAIAYFGTNYIAHDSLRPPYMHRSTVNPDDNWYDYQYVDARGRVRESYWRSHNKVGLDRGEPSRAVYAFHVLVGHHGIFSLTPIWLLSVAGGFWMWRQGDWRAYVLFVGILSLVCISFYLLRPLADRNYGGVSQGFRWVIWFAPLWLGLMPAALDRLARCRGWQFAALLLLAISVASAAYPTWNPWSYPWIMDYMISGGWMTVD